ncbi:MerR family transcriptional regulator [Streptococcus pluranimalium]|uniref:MerR family transcriptional regulator n=1 Tax=Streptococcus pluranimalium TaxID=82348 RepID=UPI0039FC5DB4
MMNLLSHEAETKLVVEMLERVDKYLEAHERLPQRETGLIPEDELKEELKVTAQTLRLWRDKGLKPYFPPVEGTRKRFYKITDVLAFLGVE